MIRQSFQFFSVVSHQIARSLSASDSLFVCSLDSSCSVSFSTTLAGLRSSISFCALESVPILSSDAPSLWRLVPDFDPGPLGFFGFLLDGTTAFGKVFSLSLVAISKVLGGMLLVLLIGCRICHLGGEFRAGA